MKPLQQIQLSGHKHELFSSSCMSDHDKRTETKHYRGLIRQWNDVRSIIWSERKFEIWEDFMYKLSD